MEKKSKCKWGSNPTYLRNSSAWICTYKIPLSMVAEVNRVSYDRMEINECLCTKHTCRCYEEEKYGKKISKVPNEIGVKYYLTKRKDGTSLMAEDTKGVSWYILTIENNGPITIHNGLPFDLGINLTEDRYPEVVEEV